MGTSVTIASPRGGRRGARRRVVLRIAALAGAYLWALALVAACFLYHRPGRRSLWEAAVTPGRPTTYVYGSSPALTLFQHDPAGAVIILVALAAALLLATVSLALCLGLREDNYRVLAIVAASLLGAFSLFGLLWGILAFAPVVALILASALPAGSGAPASSSKEQSSGTTDSPTID